MKKTTASFIALSLLSIGLAACNNGNGRDAMDTKYNDNTSPIGYYTNDRDNGRDNNNFDYIDNDGPITEMFDGGMDDNDAIRDANDRNGDRTMTARDGGNNGFQRSDVNYHDHLRNGGFDEQLAERISDQVSNIKNVDDVNVLVNDDNVVVAVDTSDRNESRVKNRIKQVVQKMAGNRQVHVATDEDAFTRTRSLQNDFRNGKDVGDDFRQLLNDIGETVTEPFDGNNR